MKPILLIVLCFAAVFPGCALQDDVNLLHNRMMSLERRVASLDSRTADMEKQSAGIKIKLEDYSQVRQTEEQKIKNSAASINASIEGVREELRDTAGRLDGLEYHLKKEAGAYAEFRAETEALNKALAKNEERIAQLEQYLNLEKSSVASDAAAAPPASAPAPAVLTEDQRYQKAKQAFDAGDYETARDGFAALLKRYPKSKNADNAQFWIGEIYYREKWYEKAILEYQKVVEKYPKGNKVAAALLKQGFSFSSLKDKANARLILKELIRKYPDSKEAKIARKKLQGI